MARTAKNEKALTPEEKLAQALVPDVEQPYRVPENWCWVKWGNVGEFVAGSGFKNEYQGFTEYEIPFYKVGSLKNSDTHGFIYDNSNTINEEIRLKLKANIIPPYSVLFAKIGEAIKLNRRSINEIACCIDNNMMAFIPKCLMRYAFYWTCGVDLYEYANATTVPAIRKSDLEMIPFPLAPLAEQQRIVDRIESLFAKLDEAKEKAQAVVDGFEDRRAAILHKAFSGELTADWRSISNIPISSWNRYKYGELGTSKLGKMLDQEKNTGRSIPYLRNVNVRWFTFDLQDVSTMLASETEIENLSVKNGDLFICEGGEPGRCAVWREQDAEMIFQKALHRFRPNEKVISEYLCYYLFYLSLNQSLNKFFTGTTIKHLTGKALAEIEVIVPSVDEQAQIVNRLQHLFDTEQMAKGAAEQAIIRIDNLKKSILARAFRGELGTNDPSEESAVELVKEILGVETPVRKRAKPVTIPKEVSSSLHSELEKKIVKLFYQRDTRILSINDIMSVSSKKFEVLESLRNLQKRNIILEQNKGYFQLVR